MYTNIEKRTYKVYNLLSKEYSREVSSQLEAYRVAEKMIISTLKKVYNVSEANITISKLIANSYRPITYKYPLHIYYRADDILNYNVYGDDYINVKQIALILDDQGKIYPLCKLDCLTYDYKYRTYEIKKELLTPKKILGRWPWRRERYKINYPAFRRGPIPGLISRGGRYGRQINYKGTLTNLSIAEQDVYREYNIKTRTRTKRDAWDIEPFQNYGKSWKKNSKVRKQWMKNMVKNNRSHKEATEKLGKVFSDNMYQEELEIA